MTYANTGVRVTKEGKKHLGADLAWDLHCMEENLSH